MPQPPSIPQLLAHALQHHQTGELAKAEALYRQILYQEPENSTALHFLGVIAYQVKNYEVAASLIKKAILNDDSVPNFYNSLGNVLKKQNKLTEAIECYQRVLTLDPHFFEAYHNLGNVLHDQGKLTEAISYYQRAITLQPNFAEAYKSLGNVLNQLQQPTEAITCLRRAVMLNPTEFIAYRNLGDILLQQTQLTEAITCFRRALSLNPNDPDTYNNLGNALARQGQLQEAITQYHHALALSPTSTWIHSNLLLNLNYAACESLATLFAAHQQFNEQQVKPLVNLIQPHLNDPNSQRRLKIGYLSQDFRQHSVAYFIEPILVHHDPSQFEIYCYYNNFFPSDQVTQRLQTYVEHWLTCAKLSDEVLAERIREDQIDILVDLAGHTANNRLLVFARKPAPVQVTYLGYPTTTGLTTIDYRITDNYIDSAEVNETFTTETPVPMPASLFCYQPHLDNSPINQLPALHNGYLTFGSFNYYAKLSDQILTCWAQLLHAVPNSKLLIKSMSLNDITTRQNCQKRFADLNIPVDRLKLTGFTSTTAEHLTMYNEVDLGLDSFPYNGATTTCEALWMGVPVVTLVGERHVSRMGLSILSTLGLTDLIAYTEAEYLRIVLNLANNITYLQHLRATMRDRMQSSPLMDAPTFTRHLEEAYRRMWEKWRSKK